MRDIKKYSKIQGSQKQRKKLKVLNKLQDDIADCYYNTKYKNKNK